MVTATITVYINGKVIAVPLQDGPKPLAQALQLLLAEMQGLPQPLPRKPLPIPANDNEEPL